MKKKGEKLLKIILTIILIVNIFAINNTKTYASKPDPNMQVEIGGGGSGETSKESEAGLSSTGMSDISTNPGAWMLSTSTDSADLNKKLGIIVSLVRTVGIVVSVASLALIGIKFMTGSVEEKAQYKQTMMPWIIGAIMIFAITMIPTLIYDAIHGTTSESIETEKPSIEDKGPKDDFELVPFE